LAKVSKFTIVNNAPHEKGCIAFRRKLRLMSGSLRLGKMPFFCGLSSAKMAFFLRRSLPDAFATAAKRYTALLMLHSRLQEER